MAGVLQSFNLAIMYNHNAANQPPRMIGPATFMLTLDATSEYVFNVTELHNHGPLKLLQCMYNLILYVMYQSLVCAFKPSYIINFVGN